jgi:lipopolysaccharide/colanic/teichoic acid biosynthesis glycosyltransferase
MSTQDISLPPRSQSIATNSSEPTSSPLENIYQGDIELHELVGTQTAAQRSGVAALPRSTVQGDVEDAKGKRDFGGWLILDLFMRQKHWNDLSKLDANAIPISYDGVQACLGAVLKRSVDCIAAILLLVLFSPLLVTLAILIKLDSKGPALFRHSRVGKGGKAFEMWKFRSMRLDARRYERSPISSKDTRLTFVGRIIRRVSLDEMPQLLNVLKGEMSLVGPRPEMAFIVEQYSHVERRRLLAKPGITGLWQISACRAEPIHHNPQYDLYYIQHQNILLDLAIMIRTISAVIRGMGAV